MSVRDLIDQFEIQGGFCIKKIDDDNLDCAVVAGGYDFECEWYNIKEKYLDAEIAYMYAIDGVLNIEVR